MKIKLIPDGIDCEMVHLYTEHYGRQVLFASVFIDVLESVDGFDRENLKDDTEMELTLIKKP